MLWLQARTAVPSSYMSAREPNTETHAFTQILYTLSHLPAPEFYFFVETGNSHTCLLLGELCGLVYVAGSFFLMKRPAEWQLQ